MSDIKLDPETHDVFLDTNKILLTDDKETIEQKIKVKLLFLFKEWFLDVTEGIPYFDKIAVKKPQFSQIESLIRNTLLSVENVTEVQELILDFNASTRVLTITGIVLSSEGELTINEGITL